jgi:serine/threonine protein kinase
METESQFQPGGHWQDVKRKFLAALERPPEDRPAFLAEACGGNEALRQEVESLLAAHEHDDAFIDPPRFGALSGLLRDDLPEDALVDRRIGAYQLQRLIASGGMGSVYLAARADGQFQAQVAIKLIKREVVSREAIRRFLHERQTLANLKHPNIARLYDGGVSEEGLPYQAMEYVDGQPIDEYCDQHRLSTTARLRLFQAVCAAVHYAHQHLIVHRDLKPSNILVTADGVPKLLDFGIAKVLDAQRGNVQTALTVTVQRAMTPEYASPEQIRGEPITTATDVYSLGVILYELLTGHRPYRVKSLLLYELERAICEEAPDKPSAAIHRTIAAPTEDASDTLTITSAAVSQTRDGQPAKLHRRLVGDVDAIVLMALHKDPRRRYASTEQLSEDIRRHLDGLPVLARKDTAGYRAATFVRRHKRGVVAAGAIAVSLLAGIVGTSWAARVAIRARQRAEAEAENARVETRKAQRVTGFLQKVLTSADPSNLGRNVSVLEVLDAAARNVAAEFGQDREVEAAIHSAIGMTYLSLGRFDDAESHARAALEIQSVIHGGDHADVALHLGNLAAVLHAKGNNA